MKKIYEWILLIIEIAALFAFCYFTSKGSVCDSIFFGVLFLSLMILNKFIDFKNQIKDAELRETVTHKLELTGEENEKIIEFLEGIIKQRGNNTENNGSE